jgi:hypothetical protein
VTQNVSDVNHPPPVFDGSDQPASIVAYIENNKNLPASHLRFALAAFSAPGARPIRSGR